MDLAFVTQVLADSCHEAAVLLVIYKIASRDGRQGISFKAQALYLLVFLARYLDLFVALQFYSMYNTLGKVFFVLTALYITVVMKYYKAKDQHVEDTDTYSVGKIVFTSVVFALLFNYAQSFSCATFKWNLDCMGFMDLSRALFIAQEVMWSVSRYMEPLLILPQRHVMRNECDLALESRDNTKKFTLKYTSLLAAYEILYLLKGTIQVIEGHIWDPISLSTHAAHLILCGVTIREALTYRGKAQVIANVNIEEDEEYKDEKPLALEEALLIEV